jgi:hypothetical protein
MSQGCEQSQPTLLPPVDPPMASGLVRQNALEPCAWTPKMTIHRSGLGGRDHPRPARALKFRIGDSKWWRRSLPRSGHCLDSSQRRLGEYRVIDWSTQLVLQPQAPCPDHLVSNSTSPTHGFRHHKYCLLPNPDRKLPARKPPLTTSKIIPQATHRTLSALQREPWPRTCKLKLPKKESDQAENVTSLSSPVMAVRAQFENSNE